MTIYLHPKTDNALSDAYNDAFNHAEEIFVLSAFLRDWRNFTLANGCTNATLIVGKDFGITRKKALRDALVWKKKNKNKCHFFVADQISGFHPKLVMWKQDTSYFLIVGSSNLTIAAFESNYEANIRIKISIERYQEISNWITQILGLSIPVTTQWIDDYEESPNPIKKPAKLSKKTSPGLIKFNLPLFPKLAKALAERKERAFAFEDIRIEFEKEVRECAAGTTSQQHFYQWLIDNWNGAEWKFQGAGIFRHKSTKTNWQLLCNSLVISINSNSVQRDHVIQSEYDKLEQSGEVEVRQAFLTEMLCHFFPDDYPLWNKPVETWLKKIGIWKEKQRGLSAGEKYIWIAKQLRLALQQNSDYPAQNLAELDHVIWAYCDYKGWLVKT
ncbi:MAG: phospholipase D family protein [Rhodoferax sp.]|uniref:phospholipase D family protein n=1 Tax=Rhodoferax sp. TaxID=50421 RepID=UPI002636B118|nr:phospholipase D family protein [Rhodoferax sp.]MDD2879373.1 phospholipase D family protein [Rhodoferax sp.]